MAPAAVLVEKVLRRPLTAESLVSCHMRQVVWVATLLVIIRAPVVDTLVISNVIIHHGIIERLLLMQGIVVEGSNLIFLECRALTH